MVIGLIVSIVDNDESARASLPGLLRRAGHTTQAFSSAEEFLASDWVGETRCLILDVALPGISGPDLQRELARRGHKIPIVFIAALADESGRQRGQSRGGKKHLFKPFSEAALLAALDAARSVKKTSLEEP